MAMAEISVIIVSWNALGYLRNCLASLRETGGALIREIIVVDNASTDGSPDMVAREFPEVILIRSTENLGFSRANNVGIARASGSMLALINSDVIVHPGCLQKLAACLNEHPKVGLVGPKVIGRDGFLQQTCRRFPTVWNTACRFPGLDRRLARWRLFAPFQTWYWKLDAQGPVDVLSGCFWLARRKAVEEVGVLDERFFFYSEDVDWCKRYQQCRWQVLYVPDASATHFGGGSSSNAPVRYSIEQLRSNLIYWKKHYGNGGKAACYLIAVGQQSLRLIVRSGVWLLGLADPDTKHKLKEHAACLRWLLTRKGA